MPKTCPRCNNKNRNNARFCNECSARFPVGPLSGSTTAYETIFDSMKKNDIKTVKAFIKNSPDVNSADNDGYTPLHWAAEYCYLPVARLLLQKGADREAKTLDGWTPLDLARTEGHSEMEALLTQSPVEPAKRNSAKPLKKKA